MGDELARQHLDDPKTWMPARALSSAHESCCPELSSSPGACIDLRLTLAIPVSHVVASTCLPSTRGSYSVKVQFRYPSRIKLDRSQHCFFSTSMGHLNEKGLSVMPRPVAGWRAMTQDACRNLDSISNMSKSNVSWSCKPTCKHQRGSTRSPVCILHHHASSHDMSCQRPVLSNLDESQVPLELAALTDSLLSRQPMD